MGDLTVVCVRMGTKYSASYVEKLRRGVHKYLPVTHDFLCLTDQGPSDAYETLDVSEWDLEGWWAKMLLFNVFVRPSGRVIYLDLDTVVVGDLSPLAELELPDGFGICANFTQRYANPTYPCRYGSCCMLFDTDFGQDIWEDFHAHEIGPLYRRYGDQKAIEMLTTTPPVLLQDALPEGFFLGYRGLTDMPDSRASLVIFAGRRTPENCTYSWVVDQWQ